MAVIENSKTCHTRTPRYKGKWPVDKVLAYEKFQSMRIYDVSTQDFVHLCRCTPSFDVTLTFIVKTMCDFMSNNHSDSAIIQRPAKTFMDDIFLNT